MRVIRDIEEVSIGNYYILPYSSYREHGYVVAEITGSNFYNRWEFDSEEEMTYVLVNSDCGNVAVRTGWKTRITNWINHRKDNVYELSKPVTKESLEKLYTFIELTN